MTDLGLMRWGNTSSALHHAEKKRLVLVDSILILAKNQDADSYGWSINHKFRYKGEFFPEVCGFTYYMDKECNQILFKSDNWCDDGVEFANRIYEEALERKKGGK